MTNPAKPSIAYFSMEIGLRSDLPTYSGGLGVLAGDTIKSAADLATPMVAVTMLYRKGYFRQVIGTDGQQKNIDVEWNPSDLLKPLDKQVRVTVEGRTVLVKAWKYDVIGEGGAVVPVLFLDTKSPENSPFDQTLSDSLYGGDEKYRIAQEIVLGCGGVKMLQEVFTLNGPLNTYHMNEGHAAFLTLELLKQSLSQCGSSLAQAKPEDLDRVKRLCVFTTHTPVAAGHDHFSHEIATQFLGKDDAEALRSFEVYDRQGHLNMTYLALKFSRYYNGVAKRHGEVSRKMFPGLDIQAITNGVHVGTWTAPAMGSLFDRFLAGWRADNHYLRYATEIPLEELSKTHKACKQDLIAEVSKISGLKWQSEIFTIGFARRAATYKRADLLFWDVERLQKIAENFGGLQVCFAGKAHPKDEGGKALIARVHAAASKLKGSSISVAYLPNYDMGLAHKICAGVDVWLNNPVKPMEASGTSGMKAALNGVPSLSTLDGWWVEGCVEGVTGWEILDQEDALVVGSESGKLSDQAAKRLYETLENTVLPTYVRNYNHYLWVMRNAIALNGSYFNTQRMVEQYQAHAYRI